MIDLLVFVPACFALNLAFGPNNLLALSHGAQRGIGFALTAGLARLLVFTPMIALSAVGLGVVLSTSAVLFTGLKLLGAAYLIWLGIKLWRNSSKSQMSDVAGRALPMWGAFRQEGVIAMGNPKAILIFAAFFPQFVDLNAYGQSYLILGSIFLGLEALAICLYAAVGKFAARAAASRLVWIERASGAGMIGFGLLLLLAKRPSVVTS